METNPLAYLETVQHGHIHIQKYNVRLFIQLAQYFQTVLCFYYLIILDFKIIL